MRNKSKMDPRIIAVNQFERKIKREIRDMVTIVRAYRRMSPAGKQWVVSRLSSDFKKGL